VSTKRIKDLLAHTVGNSRSRRAVIQQFSLSGIDEGIGAAVTASGSTGSSTQALLGGLSGGARSDVADQITTLSKQLNDLRAVQQTNIDTTNENTRALVQNTTSKASGGSTSSKAGGLISSIFGSTLGLSPIFEGIMSLFGRNSSKPVQPLEPFALPPTIQYQGGYTAASGGQVTSIDYGQSGGARAAASTQSANVQIQVNAMDSRSFLDHSEDIARAVREAMLHSNSLNDVITDL